MTQPPHGQFPQEPYGPEGTGPQGPRSGGPQYPYGAPPPHGPQQPPYGAPHPPFGPPQPPQKKPLSTGSKVGIGCGSIFAILLILSMLGACVSILSGGTTAEPDPTSTSEETTAADEEESTSTKPEEPEDVEEVEEVEEPEPLEFSGSGSTVIEVDFHDDSRIATFSHTGDSNFIVWAMDADGESTDLLVNEIGSYEGRVLYNVWLGEGVAALDVDADGSWEIALEPLSTATLWESGENEFSGSGADVIQLADVPSGLTIMDMSHDGDSNFIVEGYTDSGDSSLIVNEIGSYSGQNSLSSGTTLLAIEADGAWTFTL